MHAVTWHVRSEHVTLECQYKTSFQLLFLILMFQCAFPCLMPSFSKGFGSWTGRLSCNRDRHQLNQFCTWRLDRTIDGNGCWSALPNHSGWLLPCRLSQFLNAKTKRSAWVGVNVILVYSLLTSAPPSFDFDWNTFSCPWSTIMSPSYTLFEVQCSCHLGTTWQYH